MMRIIDVDKCYFEWLCDYVQSKGRRHYDKLLEYLHNKEFIWTYSKDASRAYDGIDLRRIFCMEEIVDRSELVGPCSMLEMMIGLSIRIEKDIMDNVDHGDRTAQWFWEMINNLGLGCMSDNKFDEDICDSIVDTFLDHEYEPNGKGGLFVIDDPEDDMREQDIWRQMCWYINTVDD